MGGKLTNGQRVPLALASRIGEEVLQEMKAEGAIERGIVAGSIRRRKDKVGDIDLVVIPGPNYDGWMRSNFGDAVNGKPKRSGLVQGIQVDVLATTDEGWGAAAMHLTGPKGLNIRQRALAKALGCMLNEKGLWEDDARVAGRTEEEVYAALGLDFLAPEER